jgi:hypothetical protein
MTWTDRPGNPSDWMPVEQRSGEIAREPRKPVVSNPVETESVLCRQLSPHKRKIARIIVRQSFLPRGERDVWARMDELDRSPKTIRGVGGCFASLDYLGKTIGRGKARVSGYRASLLRRSLVQKIGTRGRYTRWGTAIPAVVASRIPDYVPTGGMLDALVRLFNETLNLRACYRSNGQSAPHLPEGKFIDCKRECIGLQTGKPESPV